MRTPVPAAEVLAVLPQVDVVADDRRQAAVDVEGQRPLLQDVVVDLAGFLVHAPVEQVPVDEQLSAGLRAVTVRGFATLVVDLAGLRGAAVLADDVLAPRRVDAAFTNTPLSRHSNNSKQTTKCAIFVL